MVRSAIFAFNQMRTRIRMQRALRASSREFRSGYSLSTSRFSQLTPCGRKGQQPTDSPQSLPLQLFQNSNDIHTDKRSCRRAMPLPSGS